MLSVALTCRRPPSEISAAFEVAPGEALGLFGPSGAGKSTILEAIAGLFIPVAGTVTLDGRDLTRIDGRQRLIVPPWRRKVGLVRQEAGGFPHMTVAANLAYGVPHGRLDGPALALAKTLGLGGLLERPARRLSGGERRRLALAQALAAQPQALLLDEPFAALDAPVRLELGDLVRELVGRTQLPAVLVSHDLIEVQRWCDRVAVLIAGTIHQIAAPAELVAHPVDRHVARLVGYTGELPGRLVGKPDVTLAVHPERIRLGAAPERGPVVRAQVVRCVPRGPGWLVTLQVDAQFFVDAALTSVEEAPRAGETVDVTLLDPPVFGEDPLAALR